MTFDILPPGYAVAVHVETAPALKEGDPVTVSGFRVSTMEGELLVATEVRKGDKRVLLRSPRGRPVW